MQLLQYFLWLLLLATGQGQNLLSVLDSNQDLSSLKSLLETLPDFLATLDSSDDVTILAPTNVAVEGVLNSFSSEDRSAADLLAATLI